MTKLAAAALALCLARPALAAKVAGVEFPEQVDLGDGKVLKLNGAGLRKRFVVKVYAGGLYLAAPSRDPGGIVAADAPKRVRMVFLRTVGRGQVLDAYRDGFQKNSPGPGLADLVAKLERIASAIPAELKEGAEMLVTYVPGQGTTVVATGGDAAMVEGKEFADALFKNWLGDHPADEDLKSGMLGTSR